MRALLLAATALTACTAAGTPEACRITQVADIPIRMASTLPLVAVTINGHPAQLLLDTGAEITTIRDGAFERLGLERNYQATASVSGIGAQSSIWPSRPTVLSMGPVTLPPEALLVSDFRWPIEDRDQPDGLLGSKMLSAYDLDIDMVAGRLGLYERRRCPDGPPPFQPVATTLPAEGNRAYKLSVPIVLDGRPITAILDTGAGRTLVDAKAAGLAEADVAADRAIHMNGADPVGLAAHAHKFKQMTVGGVTIEGPTLMVSAFDNPGYTALLGRDVLRNRRVWISYGSRRVYLGPPQPRPR